MTRELALQAMIEDRKLDTNFRILGKRKKWKN